MFKQHLIDHVNNRFVENIHHLRLSTLFVQPNQSSPGKIVHLHLHRTMIPPHMNDFRQHIANKHLLKYNNFINHNIIFIPNGTNVLFLLFHQEYFIRTSNICLSGKNIPKQFFHLEFIFCLGYFHNNLLISISFIDMSIFSSDKLI